MRIQAFNLLCAAIISGCGGGGGVGAPQVPVVNQSPGGIWSGTDPVSGLKVVGLVDEIGDFHFIRSDGVQYVGTAMVAGDAVSANFAGYAPFGSTFPDKSSTGAGTLTGTLQPRSSLNGSVKFTTDAKTFSSGAISLTFDSLYNTGSSLTAVSGNYTDPITGDTVSVSSAGIIFSQDATTGCVINGNVSIINSVYDAYAVTFAYANCTGQAATLNGVKFSGLGTLNTKVKPVQAIIGVSFDDGIAAFYAVVLTLNRQ